MTNKTRKTLIISSNVLLELFCIGGWFYIHIGNHLEDRLVWIYIICTIALLLGFTYVLPYLLRGEVTNGHHEITHNDRLVFNGKNRMWEQILQVIASYIVGFFMVYVYEASNGYSGMQSIYRALIFVIIFAIWMSPIYGDMIYRSCKNTYTIEGGNLIVNEWAWFRHKTDHLMIPIAEIEHISKKNVGTMQSSNIIITVAGIKRTLTCGMAGDEVYEALKERMA